ncbi:hypothetical protein M2132_002014 [Dysgonomonas sp. PH5-45]|uniref:hypothetical protein n=1 Tax=unclassified Dysgonomonas TaxID=2630389 RepID=UPI002476ACE7|nr:MULTISPECIES: hypothetical protein [unclassified Dysgonomonas]MDH6355669.1 hypothetical protein [Dysgonomonas sp. PH5-45]MDH6388548.1 hypothetical protein [Dysgonomonas sp. PH5-37]
MVENEVKIHDRYSIELKSHFITNKGHANINEFKINTWVFVPNSLDINRSTYSKSQFYHDVKSNLRLITPIYSLSDILQEGRGPLPRLQKAMERLLPDPDDDKKTENYRYQIRMLMCILKSALRRDTRIICNDTSNKDIPAAIDRFVADIRAITKQFRDKRKMLASPGISDEHYEYFDFADEFLGNIIEQYSFQIIHSLKNSRPSVFEEVKAALNTLQADEVEYKRKHGYMLLKEGDEDHNRLVILRRNILKKFIETDLYLKTEKKKDGYYIEQFYYSIAAGIAMIFATVISFFATQRFGNFTTDLFIILVISYMMKDRIKDLMRYLYTSELSKRYFDTKLKLSIRNQEIGWVKEAFDFREEQKISDEILALRHTNQLIDTENDVYDEKIILYRKWVKLSEENFEKYKEYRLSGVNDITRINLFHFLQKMDDPYIPLYVPDKEEGFVKFQAAKVYPLFFVIQCESNTNSYYKAYRILLNREGITDVQEVE